MHTIAISLAFAAITAESALLLAANLTIIFSPAAFLIPFKILIL